MALKPASTQMTVSRLSVTPIKGTQLQDRHLVDVDSNGVSDNRRFYLIDERGLMFNGKRDGRLAAIAVEYDQRLERLTLHFPHADDVSGGWATGEAVTTNFYGRPVAGHVVNGPWAQALSTFIGRPVRLAAVDCLGDAVDVHPVTIISRATIESLRASMSGAQLLDHRRFRMLVEVDGIGANEEDTWAGSRVQVGSAVLQIVGPVPRCIVTSQNPDIGQRDFDTLQAIVAYRGANARDVLTPTAHLPDGGKILLGVYGAVVEPGRISVGDKIEVMLQTGAVGAVT